MDEKIKKLLLKKAEEHLMVAIDDVIEIAQVYVDDTESTIDDTVLEGVKLMKGLIKDMVDKIHVEEAAE